MRCQANGHRGIRWSQNPPTYLQNFTTSILLTWPYLVYNWGVNGITDRLIQGQGTNKPIRKCSYSGTHGPSVWFHILTVFRHCKLIKMKLISIELVEKIRGWDRLALRYYWSLGMVYWVAYVTAKMSRSGSENTGGYSVYIRNSAERHLPLKLLVRRLK